MLSLATLLLATALAADPAPQSGKYFMITVVDEQTGRGVPLVELQTVNNLRYFTDSNGVVAFHEPGLMNQTVFFTIQSHGYEFAPDGFGFHGKALRATEGGSTRLSIKRLNIAERLYRVTGEGIYRDSVLAGLPVPIQQPLLNGQVLGSDSVVNAVYRGKLTWVWGDTNRPSYPLGNFQVTGATSALPGKGGLDPEVGINLDYLMDGQGFARAMAPMPGEGPTWITSLVTLHDRAERERLFAAYIKVRGHFEVYQHGLAVFNDDKQQFEQVKAFEEHAPAYPGGHALQQRVHGVEMISFANPYPLVRVPASPEHLQRLEDYEAFTCLQPGSRLDKLQLDRGEDGKLRYAWKKNTPPLGPGEQAKAIKASLLKREEALLQLQDADTGKAVIAHAGSVSWNAYRNRWVMITTETMGTSFLGEVWYAEADTPLGPWIYARKVVTHNRYSFYNAKHHPYFDKEDGRLLFFEGTYTHSFSGNTDQTPRYDYNQILYKLDLADPRLLLPVPIYTLAGADVPNRFGRVQELKPGQAAAVAFFALDRPRSGTVPVYADAPALSLTMPRSGTANQLPVFHAIPADAKDPPTTAVPLYEFVDRESKSRAYSTERSWSRPGYERTPQPVCLVWRNPLQVILPRE